MKNIRFFLSENFQFLEVNFSTYLNRRVFVMGFYISLSTIFCHIATVSVCGKELTAHF